MILRLSAFIAIAAPLCTLGIFAAPPPKPPCYNPLNYDYETICYNVTAISGNVTVRQMGVNVDAALMTGMSAATTFAEGSLASSVPLFEYFLSDNGSFEKIPLTVPLIFRPSKAGTWLASFALPTSVYPIPSNAPEIIPGSDLLLESFSDPSDPTSGRLIAAYTFYSIQLATEDDYDAACKSLDAELPALGFVQVADSAWSESRVTYSTKEMVGNMINECWREVKAA